MNILLNIKKKAPLNKSKKMKFLIKQYKKAS